MPNKDKETAIYAVILVASFILLIIVLNPSPHPANPPINEGDHILWEVNGTRNGIAVSGFSSWIFSNVTSHSEVNGIEGWPKYDIAISTSLNGVFSNFTTSGAYQKKALWSLGLNPAVIGGGFDGYFNLGNPVFNRNETLTTVFGPKNATVYIERYNPSDFWSQIWIDANSGMPYKIEVTEPMILNGFHNDQWGTLTFELMATSISHQ